MQDNFLKTLALTACIFLAGCGFFSDEEKKPLEGKRLSVLQLQQDLTPDPTLDGETVITTSPWQNEYWPQAGGYPNHTMGHLALNTAGLKKRWRTDIGAGASRELPLMVQPVVADNVIYTIDAKARLSAFDTEKGKRLWKIRLTPKHEDTEATLGGGIAYAQGRLFVTVGYEEVRALNPQTGETIWVANMPSPTRAPPASLDGRIFITTLDNQLIALSAENGEILWKHSALTETTGLLGTASPAADRSVAVAAFSSGEIFALRPENGRVLWTDNLASLQRVGSLAAIADIRGLPVLDRGIVFAVSYGGRMVAIDQRSGSRIWQREIGGAETPWVSGNTVFVITHDQQLVALSRDTGDVYWITKLPKFKKPEDMKGPIVWTGPLLAGGHLVAASSAGHIIEINPQTGKLENKWKAGGDVAVTPLIASNTLYILNNDGELTAYR